MKKKIIALAVILVAGVGLYFAYRTNEVGPPAPVTSQATFAELWMSQGPGASNQAPEVKAAAGTTTASVDVASTAGTERTLSTGTSTETTSQKISAGEPNAQYAFAGVYQGIEPQVASAPAEPQLIFVSRESALPRGYSSNVRLANCAPGSDIQMEATAAAQYRKMFDAGKEDGITITPYSGYRSTQRQKNNFENKIASFQNQGQKREDAIMAATQSILPPGCSEHEAGLAMDIVSTDANFADTKEYKWLMENAHQYGFILRYPKDKTTVTLVKYEPWHWRYVGTNHAAKMKESGQTLEQYLGIK